MLNFDLTGEETSSSVISWIASEAVTSEVDPYIVCDNTVHTSEHLVDKQQDVLDKTITSVEQDTKIVDTDKEDVLEVDIL